MTAADIRSGAGRADRDADVEACALRREQLERRGRRHDHHRRRLALAHLQAARRQLVAVRSTAAAPARAAAATVSAGAGPAGASTARPATRLNPLASKKAHPRACGVARRKERQRVSRRDCARERQPPVEDHVKAFAKDDPDERLAAA